MFAGVDWRPRACGVVNRMFGEAQPGPLERRRQSCSPDISIAPLDHQAPGAPGIYQLVGKFTLHGTEKDLQIKAKLDASGLKGQMTLTGSFKIKQSEYGIKPYSTLGGAVKVSDELDIMGDLLLSPQGK